MLINASSLALQIGNRKTVLAVQSIGDAKRVVNALRDRMEENGRGGASRFPQIRIRDLSTGAVIGHFSYNGRAWEGEPQSWTPSTREMV